MGMIELMEKTSLVLEGVLTFITGLCPISSVLSCKDPELSLTENCSNSPDFRHKIQGEKVRDFLGRQLRKSFKGGTEIRLLVSGKPCPSMNQNPFAGLVRALG